MAIYDCFSFFNEVDLLKVRLEMMNPIVDKFVIVEMNKTYRGIDKPYNFLNHIDEFEKYKDKIIYINPTNIPEYKGDGDWTIENYSRNSIMQGLKECKPDDIIICSDLDEIPNPNIFSNPKQFKISKLPDRSIKRIIKIILKNKSWWLIKSFNNWMNLLEYTPVACQQDMFYYFFNCKCKTKWYGTVICKYKNLKTTQDLRRVRGAIPYIKEAGWHCSYFGGIESIKEKLKTIIDNRTLVMDTTKKYSSDEEFILNRIHNSMDIYGREDVKFDYINYDQIIFPNKDQLLSKYPKFFSN